ncbi:GATOR complex protein NPRL2-like [Pieris brassicae]|uniref:Nitrogen permease regulator 2-like protein n=1 Tax=Pieris brassicae TaxID=7116 RepID=A0A9P0XL45_PIEBR|nr:GATOR complex protein NPRL2-like [Pieris brassicae]CAH4039044.1 unnamed protein product [Pieris brassicae]
MSSKSIETRYYEGCGRIGPIRCIFLSEFHPVAGPKIVCQFPEDNVSKDVFHSISAYIIPKPQFILKCTMTINSLGHKIIGYPIRIENTRYERNMYIFNLCFVCDSWSKTVQYEPVVKKLGEYLVLMEEETGFVSKGSSRLPTLLAHLFHDLNTYHRATLAEGDTAVRLLVGRPRASPPPVHDHDVPVPVLRAAPPSPPPTPTSSDEPHLEPDADWDLTTAQLLPHIDGYNHVSKIAADADVEKTLVKSCIRNLLYYGVVRLVPVLKFSNTYRATPALSRFFRDPELQAACLAYAAPTAPRQTALRDVGRMLCSLQQGSPLRGVCERWAGLAPDVDVRRLVIFAQLHGLIRCIKRYPLWRGSEGPGAPGGPGGTAADLRRLFTGALCEDEICCRARLDLPSLRRIVDEDPDVAVVWR